MDSWRIPGVGLFRNPSLFQITAAAGFLGRVIDAPLDTDRMNEVFAEMGDVLQKERLVAHADVVEKDEMLVELAHVADMGDHGNPELF